MAYPQLRASYPSSFTNTAASSVVCTHPTGLTTGDTMVLFVGIFNAGTDRSVTTPAGWTLKYTSDESLNRTLHCYFKVATAGDVSAGSTTVSFSGSTAQFGYGMFAITGAASGNEITVGENDQVNSSTASITATTNITPVVSESLVISAFLAIDLAIPSPITASSFSLTPTTTLTERVDVGARDGLSDGASLLIATGEYSGLSAITSRSVSVNHTLTGDASQTIIILVNSPQNASGTNSLLEVQPVIFTNAGVSVGGTGTNTLLNVSPTFPTQSGQADSRPVWNNPNKGTSTWTNPNK